MVCDCTSFTKNIKINYGRATPIETGCLNEILDKNCYKDTEKKLVAKKSPLLVHLEFDNTVVTAVEVYSNFKKMKIFFSEISLRNYKKQREDYLYDLMNHHSEYKCKRSAVEMTLVFEDGNELYFLKVKGNAPGIIEAVNTKYELMGTDKLMDETTSYSYSIGH